MISRTMLKSSYTFILIFFFMFLNLYSYTPKFSRFIIISSKIKFNLFLRQENMCLGAGFKWSKYDIKNCRFQTQIIIRTNTKNYI